MKVLRSIDGASIDKCGLFPFIRESIKCTVTVIRIRRAGVFRAVKILAMLSILSVACKVYAAELPTDEVLQKCRVLLTSERGAKIPHWSTKPLPPEYRHAAGLASQDELLGGWIAHTNPNRTLTVVIHAFDAETREGHFVVLVKDKSLALKDDVSAFEFALSSREHNGMTGFFFCSKTGPSAEWVWDDSNWKIVK